MSSIKVPHHLAVIPDGNRRWSRKRGLPLNKGYRYGVINFTRTMEASFEKGVKYFTIWGASEDNLRKRSKMEIAILSSLLKEELGRWLESPAIMKNKVRVRIIGNGIAMLKNKEIERLANEIEEKTKNFSNHYFTLLFGYDGKTEMLSAISDFQKNPKTKPTYESVKSKLMTRALPPVDLVIRTGGEPHWSAGFLMWHTADSEFYFTETFWPGFTPKELDRAFKDYAGRRSLKGK